MTQANGAADTRAAFGRWIAEVEAACADGRPRSLEVVDLLRRTPRHTYRRIAEVARLTGYAYGTVSAWAWLADRVPADVARADVSLSAHFAVAKLPVPVQRLRLAEAAAEGLAVPALRERIAEGAAR